MTRREESNVHGNRVTVPALIALRIGRRTETVDTLPPGPPVTNPVHIDRMQATNLTMFSTEFRVPSAANGAPVDQQQAENLTMFSTEFRVPSAANGAPIDQQQTLNLTAF